ncbi:hypothetical protein BASA60_005397 [Batrachochytrium salamandrivorans]|nr:hypothetical protein BASA60_005397 [Batrachochytrium salamandrivorans]
MRLISFAMVSLLAITVSAQPPHNPDTDAMDKYLDDAIQNMHQYQNDAAHNSQQPHDADIDMLDQILNDITQNAQQPQGAATHSAQQSPDAATQNVQQPPDAATQSAQPSDQNIVMAEMNRLMGGLQDTKRPLFSNRSPDQY